MAAAFSISSEKRKSSNLFIVGVFESDKTAKEIKKVDPILAETIRHAYSEGRFEAKSGQSLSSYSQDFEEASEALILGLGDKKKYDEKTLRKALSRAFQGAKAAKVSQMRLYADSFVSTKVSVKEVAECVGELEVLCGYSFDRHKQVGKKKKSAAQLLKTEVLLSKRSSLKQAEKSRREGNVVAEGTLLTRDLINEPANIMNAPRLASEAKKMAAKHKLSCQVLGAAEIKKFKMGGVLAVNQGSPIPPAFIILEHGKKYKSKGTVCLVGKGVTFDTGGLSIKPAKGMEKMKYDMSGAACVIGTMQAVADLNLPVHVVGITPAVENNVSEDPIRPGDIITMYNGKTVEVLNTDAEGRLILADALAYTEKYKPKAVIDAATLTGMAVYTFGNKCCAVMGTDQKLIDQLTKAGDESNQRCWQLPLYDEYESEIKGTHSDLQNIGGAHGGTITAAMFLKQFVPKGVSWAHLDIAGVAWCDSPRPDCPKGGAGFGVKLLTQYLKNIR